MRGCLGGIPAQEGHLGGRVRFFLPMMAHDLLLCDGCLVTAVD
jgi:hypothetical protein